MASLTLAKELIRSSDELQVVLDVTQLSPESNSAETHKRVLLVVSHKDDWDLTEEGR